MHSRAERWRIVHAAHTIGREGSSMFSYLFTFRSLTAAQSGRNDLYRAGIETRIQRAPQEVSSLGCAWAVRVPAADGLRAAALLRTALRPISGIYRLHPNGYLEGAAL